MMTIIMMTINTTMLFIRQYVIFVLMHCYDSSSTDESVLVVSLYYMSPSELALTDVINVFIYADKLWIFRRSCKTVVHSAV